jgi:two-component system response regulator
MNAHILLVEDNPSDEKLTLLAFRTCGVPNELTVLRDGQEALDYLLGPSPAARRPALMLLDLKLPRVDGFEVLRRVRAEAWLRTLPIVILSASVEAEDIEQSYFLGANAYIRKPVDFMDFKRAVHALSEFWLHWNERAAAGVKP